MWSWTQLHGNPSLLWFQRAWLHVPIPTEGEHCVISWNVILTPQSKFCHKSCLKKSLNFSSLIATTEWESTHTLSTLGCWPHEQQKAPTKVLVSLKGTCKDERETWEAVHCPWLPVHRTKMDNPFSYSVNQYEMGEKQGSSEPKGDFFPRGCIAQSAWGWDTSTSLEAPQAVIWGAFVFQP